MPLPEIREVGKIIDAIRDYAVASAHECHEEHLTDKYRAPSLSSWDSVMWFELLQDWELADFLVSGTDRATRLLKSLQYCLQWHGQREIDETISRLKIMSMIN
ncbi:MAG: hypothetical protein WA610_06590 [Thermodesulfovibrionales bacterium]